MSEETLGYKKHFSLQVGQYFQVYDEDNPRKSNLTHIKGSMSIGPIRNLQGGFKFMVQKIVCQSWDIIPIPYFVIARVNALGRNQPHHTRYTYRHGRLIGDIEIPAMDSGEEEDAYFPGVEPVIEDDIEIPGVDVEVPEASAPQIVEINYPGIPQDDPAPIQVAPTQEVPAPQASAPVAEPAHA
jgi:hypothetical protein